jgi:WD40 repeat protein
MTLFSRRTAFGQLLYLGLLALALTAPPARAVPPGTDAPRFTVKLTRRFEVSDHRGRLAADGKSIFVEWWDSTGKIKVLDARSGKEIYAFDKQWRGFDLSPDGKRLTTLVTEFRAPYKPPKGQKEFEGEARYYNEMQVWDVSKPQSPRPLLLIPDAYRPIFSPDRKSLVVFHQEDNKPTRWELWNLVKAKKLASFAAAQSGDYVPAFSPAGDDLAVPSPDAIQLVDAATGKEMRALAHKCGRPLSEINCVLFTRGNANVRNVFAPDGKTLATGGDDGKVKLWDVATGRLTATLEGHSQPHTFVCYSPDGGRLLTGSIGLVQVLRVAPGLPGKGPPVTAKVKIIDRDKGEVILWNAGTRARERTLPIRCPASLSWSADGKVLVVGDQYRATQGKPNSLQLWDVARGQLLGTWPGFNEGHFAADGRTLLTSAHGRVAVWNVERVPQE